MMVDPETREADFNSEVTFQCLSVGEFLSSVIVIAISVLENLFKVKRLNCEIVDFIAIYNSSG